MGRMNELMQMVQICEDFGWTYQEYFAQPSYFIRAIKEKMVRDNKEQSRVTKKQRG